MAVSKKITKGGALTLPRLIREETGILPGVPVDIELGGNGDEVHIRKHVPACRFCGSVDEVASACGIEICRTCAEKFQEAFS